ncbi:conserved hypothetical protein [Flavobacterium sp. 9AF]|uniref:hypothetical protein n=1 Tax=Flavobacterium sp. 9AF TaxID=2653142 RepID=UPI0012F27A5D|nr:hypothetical protein [Flavobacterium sp. 9AF]VXC30547.1 conserved hypothetical protein [Flavobacterium sp. 9AF]
MKKNIFVIVTFISLFFISCSDKCIEGNQPTPASFFIEVIDENTSENVFQNGTFLSANITVTDVIDTEIPFEFVEGTNIIHILPKTTINANNIELKVTLNNPNTMETEQIFLKYNVSSQVEECYTSFHISNVLFPQNQSQYEEGVFVVKI